MYTKFLAPAILGTAATLLFPMAAGAEQQVQQSVAAQESYEKANDTAVLGVQTLADQDNLTVVTDENGRVFFNQVVETEELPAVTHDLDVVDTYTFEHNGRVYTNKVVANKA